MHEQNSSISAQNGGATLKKGVIAAAVALCCVLGGATAFAAVNSASQQTTPDPAFAAQSSVQTHAANAAAANAGDDEAAAQEAAGPAGIASLFTVSATADDEDVAVIDVNEDTDVCEIIDDEGNAEGYETIAAALEAASSEETTIALIQDEITEDVRIGAEQVITLDLNGCTLKDDGNEQAEDTTGSYKATVVNEGTLTVTDSNEESDGTIDAETHQCAALSNDINATCTIEGGTFTRSQEAGTSSDSNGGNSYYTVCNEGTMTIGEADADDSAIKVSNTGVYSSMIENGFTNGSTQDKEGLPATLTINSGTFAGGKYTIKSDDYSELVINGGTFYNEDEVGSCILVWNNTTINGGTFYGTYCVITEGQNAAAADDMDSGTIHINGGTFVSEEGTIFGHTSSNTDEDLLTEITVYGGTFIKTEDEKIDISAYLAPGLEQNEDGTVERVATVLTLNITDESLPGDKGEPLQPTIYLDLAENATVTVDWGDDSDPQEVEAGSKSVTKTDAYAAAGTYDVTITAECEDTDEAAYLLGLGEVDDEYDYVSVMGYYEDNRLTAARTAEDAGVQASSFDSCTALETADLRDCNLSGVDDLSYLFIDCSSLDTLLGVEDLVGEEVELLDGVFCDCSSLGNVDVSGWDVENVTEMYITFYGCDAMTEIDLSTWNTESLDYMAWMLASGEGHDSSLQTIKFGEDFDTSNVTNMNCLFTWNANLETIEGLDYFDTSEVIDMSQMFCGCNSLSSIDVSNFDTAEVTDMCCMFWAGLVGEDDDDFDANLEEINFGDQFITNNVTDMAGMFNHQSSLTDLDVSGFDTSKVTDMTDMFSGCSSITSLDLSGFSTEAIEDDQMSGICDGCTSLQKVVFGKDFKVDPSLNPLPASTFTTPYVASGQWQQLTDEGTLDDPEDAATISKETGEEATYYAAAKSLEGATFSLSPETCEFTGDVHEPTVTVETDLEPTVGAQDENPGFTLFYTNENDESVEAPFDVGTYTVYANGSADPLTAFGNYTGTVKVGTYEITQEELQGDMFRFDPEVGTYSGTAVDLEDVLKTSLVEERDYTLVITNESGEEVQEIVNAGTYTFTFTGMGNYTGSEECTYTINPAEATITVQDLTATYGTPISEMELSYEVECDVDTAKDDLAPITCAVIDEGTSEAYPEDTVLPVGDYELSATYAENSNYTVKVATGTLTIEKQELTDDTFTLDPDEVTYTGEAIDVDALIETTLVEDEDYELVITDKDEEVYEHDAVINAGEYTLTFTGIDNCEGEVTKTFTVNPAPVTITADSKEAPYGDTIKDLELGYTVECDVEAAEEDLNPVVHVKENDDPDEYYDDSEILPVGEYVVTVTYDENPNYEVTVTDGTLNVVAKELDDTMFTLDPTGATYTSEAIPVTIKTDLEENTDYTYTIYDDTGSSVNEDGDAYTTANLVDKGNYYFVFHGQGNYTGRDIEVFGINDKELEADDFTLGSTEATYTGSTIAVTVNTALAEGQDYTLYITLDGQVVETEDIIDAGTYTFTFIGIGNYYGTVTKTFTVNPASLAGIEFSCNPEEETYTGEAITPEIEAEFNGMNLERDTDYTYTIEDGEGNLVDEIIDAGTYTFTFTGIGNFTDTTTATLTVDPATLDESMFSFDPEDATYNGEAVDVTINSSLEEDLDYTYECNEGEILNAGTYTFTFTGVGNYAGSTCTKEFTVNPASVTITADSKEATYGDTIENLELGYTLECDVEAAEEVLNPVVHVEKSDDPGEYYEPDTILDVGAYTVTVTYTENSNYTVEVTDGELTITEQAIDDSMFSLEPSTAVYTGSPIVPEIVTDLEENTDYTYAIKDADGKECDINNLTEYGAYTFTFTGMGNYTGTATATFTITKETLTESMFNLSIEPTVYNGQPVTVTINTALTEGVDYVVAVTCDNQAVERNSIVNAGTYTFVLTGIGNYEGTVTLTVTLDPAPIDDFAFEVSAEPDTYTGEPVSVTTSCEGLERDTDYIVTGIVDSEGNEVKEDAIVEAGTYTFTFEGQGNYTGSTTATLTINPASVEGLFSLNPDTAVYTGDAINPEIVTDLIADTDYTYSVTDAAGDEVDLDDMVDADTYTYTFTGTGNYTGEFSVEFTITAAAATIAADEAERTYGDKIEDMDLTYTVTSAVATAEEELSPITCAVINEEAGGNYDPSTILDVGDYDLTVTYTENDNYTVEVTNATLTIVEKELADTMFELNPTGAIYTGDPVQVEVETDLVEDKDYTLTIYDSDGQTADSEGVTYTINNLVHKGTYYFVFYGQGNYTGYDVEVFGIAEKQLASDSFRLNPTEATYTGSAASVSVATSLLENTDYMLFITRDGTFYDIDKIVDTGTYTFTFVGIGDYAGTVTKTFTVNPAPLTDDMFTLDPSETTYDGSAIDVTITGTFNEMELVEGTDYTYVITDENDDEVAITDIVNAGIYTFTFTGIGNYTDTATATLTVDPVTLEESMFSFDPAEATYSGEAVDVKVAGQYNDLVLEEGTDFSYTVEPEGDILAAGDYTFTFTGAGNYDGTCTKTFTVSKAAASITVNSLTATYGPAISDLGLTYTVDGLFDPDDLGDITCVVLNQSGTAYSADTVLGVGTYTVTVTYTDNDNYEVSVTTGTLTIETRPLEDSMFTLDPYEYVYDGAVVNPTVTAECDGVTLVADTDYELVSITDQDGEEYDVDDPQITEVGVYTFTFEGIGNYSGTATATLTIAPHQIVDSDFRVDFDPDTYTGEPIDVKIVTMLYDYDYAYSITGPDGGYYSLDNIVNAGTYTFTFVGQGDYVGTVVKTITIKPASISDLTFTVTADPDTYNGSPVEVTTDCEGLELDTDYVIDSIVDENGDDVAVDAITDAGTYTFTFEGIGNYTDTATATLTINPATISDLNFEVASTPDTYTGDPVEVSYSCEGLEAGTDYDLTSITDEDGQEIDINEIVNAGDYTFTFTGKGNYTGTATATLTIAPASMEGLTFTVTAEPSVYNGEPVTITTDCEGLVLGTDYAIASIVDEDGNTYNVDEIVNAGTYTFTFEGIGNYTGTATATLVIEPASLAGCEFTVSATPDAYTGDPVEVSYSCEGLVEGTDYERISITDEDGQEIGIDDIVNVGTYTFTFTGIGNYTDTTTATLTINPRPVTITPNYTTKYYGDADPSSIDCAVDPVEYEGFDFGDVYVTRERGENVGAYTTSIEIENPNPNFDITLKTGTFVIEHRTVVVGMHDMIKTINDEMPSYDECMSYTYIDNDVKGDISVEDFDFKANFEGDEYSGATYTVTPNVTVDEEIANNYQIDVETGTLSVVEYDFPRGLTATYGDKLSDVDISEFTGWQWDNPDDYVGTVNATNVHAATYYDEEGVPVDTHNLSVKVSQREVELTWSGYETRVYDGTRSDVQASIDNLVEGDEDDVRIVITGGDESDAGSWTATAELVESEVASNYELVARHATRDYVIEHAPLVINVHNASKTYGEDDPEFTADYDGIVYGESLVDETTIVRTNADVEDVGRYEGVLEASCDVTGDVAKNYAITFEPGDFEILPKQITTDDFDVDTASELHTGEAITKTVTSVSGLVEGTDYAVAYSNNTDIGTATITISGQGNYTGTLIYSFRIVDEELTEDMFDIDLSNEVYTGQAITKEIKTEIATGEYAVFYEDNLNVGTATITIIGYGDHAGTLTFKFSIVAKAITEDMFEFDLEDETYTGHAITKSVTSDELAGHDYTVEYFNNTEVGHATMTITGQGNYTGSFTYVFEIVAAPISSPMFTVDTSDVAYTGEPIEPTVESDLEYGTDYTVAYSHNVVVGLGTITITGQGNYTGTLTYVFEIVGAQLEDSMFYVDTTAVTYTGAAFEPAVTTDLELGTDYTVSYLNNVNAGTATVTFTGQGNYTGSVSYHFTINPAPLTADMFTVDTSDATYTGREIAKSITGRGLTSSDYTVSYSNNVNVGTATITITGRGNYTGAVAFEFKIVKAGSTAPKVGETVNIDGAQYTITSNTTARYNWPLKSTTKANVATEIHTGGKTYKVTAVDTGAFKNNKKLTSVTIGDNVTSIPSKAFVGSTGITKIIVGKKVKTIGSQACSGLTSLKSFKVKSTVLSQIGKSCFKGCKKLKKITVKSKKLKKKGVKKALKGSSVKTVKTSKGLKKAYKKAFTKKNCGAKVKVK